MDELVKENFEIMYDKEEDIISLVKQGEKSKFSFEISLPKGDIVIDYGFNSQIIGLEMFNASEYIPALKQILDIKKLEGKMSVQYGPNWAQISFSISSPELKEPILQSINAPYNKNLIKEN